MSSCRLVVVSCQRRKPIQEIWKACREANWPDCPFPIDIISPDESQDRGWNANLIAHIDKLSETFVLLMLDDNFIEPRQPLTSNIRALLELMKAQAQLDEALAALREIDQLSGQVGYDYGDADIHRIARAALATPPAVSEEG